MDARFAESKQFVPVFRRKRIRLANGQENDELAEREFQRIMRMVESRNLGDERRIDTLAEEHLAWFEGVVERGKVKQRRLEIKAAYLRDFCGHFGNRRVTEFFNGHGDKLFDDWFLAHNEGASIQGNRFHVQLGLEKRSD